MNSEDLIYKLLMDRILGIRMPWPPIIQVQAELGLRVTCHIHFITSSARYARAHTKQQKETNKEAEKRNNTKEAKRKRSMRRQKEKSHREERKKEKKR